MFQRLILLLALASAAAAQSTNDILLHASKAIVHGQTLRYEPETNKICLGYWTNPNDWAEWKFTVDRPGVFEVELWQGCGKGQGGSDVRIEVAGQTIDFVVDETGHFQSFIPRLLGRVRFATAGEYALSIKPRNKKAAAVLDVRQVRLIKHVEEAESSIVNEILNARRIVFLGDSITYSGEYIEFLETLLRRRHPRAEFDIINLGLPSETVSGLSEPGHAGGEFPRPNLHERLARILQKAKPDLIFACYGMNDGIYHPFSEERFARFKDGMIKLREQAAAAGARVIHITPPVFDATQLKGKTLPAGRTEYRQPFEGYDEVLARYSQWLVDQHADGWEVIDVHTTMKAYLEDQRQHRGASFRLAGDGVHINEEGHWLVAQEIIGFQLQYSEAQRFGVATRPEEIQARHKLRRDAWLAEIGHRRPGIAKGKELVIAEQESAALATRIAQRFDPLLPGKRVHWEGFETRLVEDGGVKAQFLDANLPVGVARSYTLRTNLSWEVARLVGMGANVVIASAENATNVARAFSISARPATVFPRPITPDGRPLIRKLGSIDLDLVETTPIVHSGRLWRFEWVRDGYWNNKRKTNYFRFRDPKIGEVTKDFADGHEFGSAFVHDGTVYVTGTSNRTAVNVFASKDLATWEKWNAIPAGKYGIFNTSICKAGGEFLMMFEIDKPAEEAGVPFTARFAKSTDLRSWQITSPEMNYAKDRYTAPHALRWHEGWFYNFYLEARDGYEMRVVRSRDLIKWEPSPLNPVLRASPQDRRIASADMPNNHRARVANAINLNNSDIDFCEHQGRLRITYSWGNQQGMEHLAEAVYDGPESEFLQGWFPP